LFVIVFKLELTIFSFFFFRSHTTTISNTLVLKLFHGYTQSHQHHHDAGEDF
jgi:hypothetical protein